MLKLLTLSLSDIILCLRLYYDFLKCTEFPGWSFVSDTAKGENALVVYPRWPRCVCETLFKWAPPFTLNAVSQPCENAVTMKRHLLEMKLVAFLFFPKPLRTGFSLQPEWRNSASIQCVFIDFQWHLLTVQFKTVSIIDLKLSCNRTEEKRPLLIQKSRATTQHADLPNWCW